MAISSLNRATFTSGHIAGQIFRDIPNILLLFYLTSIADMNPAVAGLAIFIPKALLGSVFDFSVGLVSDRNVERFPRRNWLLIGAILAPLAMLMLFAVPAANTSLQFAYVLISVAFYMGVFSSLSVPHLAQYSEVSESPLERADLMAWRHGYVGVGLLLGASGAPAMIQYFGADRTAYIFTAGILGVVASVSLLLAYWASRRMTIFRKDQSGRRLTLKGALKALTNKHFAILLAVFVGHQVAAGMGSASVAFFLKYNLGLQHAVAQVGMLVMCAGLAVIAASPLWIYLSRKFSTRACYQLSVIAHCILLATRASCGPETPMYVMYAFSVLIGLANSGWGIMLLGFFSDLVAEQNARADDAGGTMAALWTLGEKVGLAVGGTVLAGSLLAAFGLSVQGEITDMAKIGIALGFGWLPAALHLVVSLLFWKFVVLPSDKKLAEA